MSRTLHLKVHVGLQIDLNSLWASIRNYSGAHLSGEESGYVIVYDGDKNGGLNVLAACLENSDSGKFYADYN